ncbi:MAG TPA: FMN reductase [Propionibacteriaceae bacterium]|nr:FMN reductase [Propionibacteriaceae bacterium]
MSGPVRVVAVSAGVGQPSSTRMLTDRLTAATERALREAGAAVETEVIELRDHAHDVTNNVLTGFAGADLAAAKARLVEADALVAVSPIFNASYSGMFKSFFDVLDPDALVGRPVLIGATGGSTRHSLALEHALRPMFSYLRATVVPTAVYAASSDWASPGELATRIDRAGRELAQLARPGLVGTSEPATSAVEDEGELILFSRLLAAQRSAAAQHQR